MVWSGHADKSRQVKIMSRQASRPGWKYIKLNNLHYLKDISLVKLINFISKTPLEGFSSILPLISVSVHHKEQRLWWRCAVAVRPWCWNWQWRSDWKVSFLSRFRAFTYTKIKNKLVCTYTGLAVILLYVLLTCEFVSKLIWCLPLCGLMNFCGAQKPIWVGIGLQCPTTESWPGQPMAV